jgi:protein-L-isoaspartate(D-aspartate) O-methyltransferase
MITLYEPLGLDEGHTLLEIGAGSGYTIVIAREIVGSQGKVVCVEIEQATFESAKAFIDNAGYTDIVLVLGDGYFGYPELSPYDRICITAACDEIPPPLVEQLKNGGKLIAPVLKDGVQEIVLLEKKNEGLTQTIIRGLEYEVPFIRMTRVNERGEEGKFHQDI